MAVYRLSLEGHVGADIAVCVWHFSDAAGAGTPNDLINGFITNLNDVVFMNCISSQYILDLIRAVDIIDGRSAEQVITTVGALSGDPLPEQCAAVVSWRTGLIGRRRRGRSYVWAASETMQLAGRWTAPYITTLTTFANTFITPFTTAFETYRLGVYSYVGVHFSTAVAYKIDPIVRSQRRRVEGVGA